MRITLSRELLSKIELTKTQSERLARTAAAVLNDYQINGNNLATTHKSILATLLKIKQEEKI